MKQEDLLDAIGEVDEGYIAEAEKRWSIPFWLKPLALCAFLAMALMVLVLPFGNLDFGAHCNPPVPDGPADYEIPPEELTYTHYAGPLLPLTLLKDCPEITAGRRVEYDFPSYHTDAYWDIHSGYADVVDTYQLTNGSAQPQTVTLVYPFIGSLLEQELFPSYTLNGEPVTPDLHPGPFSGTFFETTGAVFDEGSELRSYLAYAALLADGSYFSRAMDEPISLDLPVTVYKLTDFTNQSDPYLASACLRIEFEYDPEQTMIFTDHLSSGMTISADWQVGSTNEYEGTGIYFLQRLVREDRYTEAVPSYLIVAGKDLEGYRLKGYRNAFGYDGGTEEIEGLGCTVERFESTLGEMLRVVVADDTEEFFDHFFMIPPEDLALTLELAAELIYDFGCLSPSRALRFQELSSAAYIAYDQERVFYATVEVTIPAGETVEFAVNRIQNKSLNRSYHWDGYDLCTTLGSNLRFSEQTVRVSGWEWIQLIREKRYDNQLWPRENYGLDPENGITEVTLDLEKPHYWFEIRKK